MTERDYTPYQKGVIRRYYRHRDELRLARLGELVTELYLLPPGRKADRAWERAAASLRELGCPAARVDYVASSRDLEELSRIVGELF